MAEDDERVTWLRAEPAHGLVAVRCNGTPRQVALLDADEAEAFAHEIMACAAAVRGEKGPVGDDGGDNDGG